MKNTIQGAALGLFLQLSFVVPTLSQQPLLGQVRPVSASEVPLFGTFRSMTLMQPPFPFNPFPELPVYSLSDGTFVYDDRQVDYVTLRAETSAANSLQFSSSSVLIGGGGQAITLSSPPPPGGGGGSGGGSGMTSAPPYSMAGLKVRIPVLTNGAVFTSVFEADTNSAYDLFERLAFQSNSFWTRVASTEIGGTNFAILAASTNAAFYLAADTTDSDFDGLSDAYESLVSKTSSLAVDSDSDGLPDGSEDWNGNSVPDRFDYARLTRAVIFASRTNAFEGGQSGELTVLMPSPAPAGGINVLMSLGGSVDYDLDYRLSTLSGSPVTNAVFLAAGLSTVKVLVLASNDLQQASRPRQASFSLLSAGGVPVDSGPAVVALVDNDLPMVSLTAGDAIAAEAPGAATNTGRFTFTRDGSLAAPLTVFGSVGGSAINGTDYAFITTPVIIPAGSNRVTFLIQPLPDTVFEDDELMTMTLTANAAYTISTNGSNASVTIKDDDLPVVTIAVTDSVAAEYSGPDQGTFTIQRTGNLSKPLIVPLAIGGTASAGVDYVPLTNRVILPANVSQTTLQLIPVLNAVEEQAESVIVTIKGSLAYTIGASNTATIFIDDNSPTRYQTMGLKSVSVYAAGIDSPAIFDILRFGRSSQAATLPFQIRTNVAGGTALTSFYRVYGNVQGNNNAVFPAFATKARLNFTAPSPGVTSGSGGVNLIIPAIDQSFWSIVYQPGWQFVRLEALETNAIEGSATIRARLRLSRPVAGPAVTVSASLAGSSASSPDHNLGTAVSLTLANNATSTELIVTATADTAFEGWKTINILPDFDVTQASLEWRKPFMLFLADNVADTEALPAADFDLDGLPDRWETANGLDPFDAADAPLDPDKDGLTNADEYQRRTHPQSADTDGDGIKDFAESAPDLALDPDYVELRLVTKDTGKVNNGAGCAVCHTTELRVGDLRHYTLTRNEFSEKSFFVRKGTNYPMWLSELLRNLPPTPVNTGTPSTTETYTAAVLPGTNLPAAFIIQDAQTKLGTNKPWAQFPANPNVSFGTVIVPKIDVLFTNLSGNVALDANPNEGGGLRVYPDQLNPTDSVLRNVVSVRIKTTPPLSGQAVRLKSFDVDDPTSWDVDVDRIIDPNDKGAGFRGLDNQGTNASLPGAGALAQTVVTLNAQGEASTTLTVPMAAGNNFRVAALLDTAGASAHLDKLQVTNIQTALFVTPDQEQVEGFVGTVSPMLTVWRKLHLEFDSMAAPPASGVGANFVNATVLSFNQNTPSWGKSLVFLNHSSGEAGQDVLAGGKLEVPGVKSYRIVASKSTFGFQNKLWTHVQLDELFNGPAPNTLVKLFDDDDRYLADDSPAYPSILGLQSPPLPALDHVAPCISTNQPKFAAAYITLVNANAQGWNAAQTVPFVRHADIGLVGSSFDIGNQDLKGKDRESFWAFTVVFGYEAAIDEDGDADTEIPLGGATREPLGGLLHSFAAIYLESTRERQFRLVSPAAFVNSGSASTLVSEYLNDIYGVIAHEIGHAPGNQIEGADHAEGGIMVKGAFDLKIKSFEPLTIKRFRGASKWSN